MEVKRECIVNPISLFYLTIITSILVLLGKDYTYFISLLYSLFLVITYSNKKFIKNVTVFCVLILLLKLFSSIKIGMAGGTFVALIALYLRLYPVFMIGSILIESSPMKLMSALRWLKIPNSIIVAWVVSFRFLDEIGIRLKEIRAAMKVRGLKLSLMHPIYSFELYLIPLVYKCLNISETLVSSIISRGIEYEGEKTSFIPLRFNFSDYVYITIPLILLGVSL